MRSLLTVTSTEKRLQQKLMFPCMHLPMFIRIWTRWQWKSMEAILISVLQRYQTNPSKPANGCVHKIYLETHGNTQDSSSSCSQFRWRTTPVIMNIFWMSSFILLLLLVVRNNICTFIQSFILNIHGYWCLYTILDRLALALVSSC